MEKRSFCRKYAKAAPELIQAPIRLRLYPEIRELGVNSGQDSLPLFAAFGRGPGPARFLEAPRVSVGRVGVAVPTPRK